MTMPSDAHSSSSRRNDRMVAILAMLRDHDEVPLRTMAATLGASAATIRRDVASLAEQGLLIRSHGTARRAGTGAELPVNLRDGRRRRAKEAIAHAVASELPVGRHAIGLTGGTTTTEIVRALHHRHDLTLITNSVSIALEAASQGQQRVLITGGVLRPSFKQVNVGTAIVGCDGLSAEGGLTTHDGIEAAANHTMIKRAARIIAAVDGSKIGRVTLAKLAEAKDVDLLVTDDSADPDELTRLRALGIAIRIVHASTD